MKKNVLIYSTYHLPYQSGITIGMDRVWVDLKRLVNLRVICFNHAQNKLETQSVNGYETTYMPYLFRFTKGFISPQSLYYFIQNINRFSVVIVNFPNTEALVLCLLTKLFRKKLILLYHCNIDLGSSLSHRFISFVVNTTGFVEAFFADKVIFNKNYSKRLFVGKVFKNKIIEVIPPIKQYPINKSFQLKLENLKGGDFLVGFGGRIAAEKGIEFLIDSLVLLRENHNLSTKLLLAGPQISSVVGEESYQTMILEKLKTSRLDYKFLGNLEEDEMGAFLASLDLLVLPSINSTESFGMVQAEAMVLGTPVVASDIAGVNTPLLLSKMGLLVSPKSTSELANAVLEILTNKQKYSNQLLVDNARKYFNIKGLVDVYLDLIS